MCNPKYFDQGNRPITFSIITMKKCCKNVDTEYISKIFNDSVSFVFSLTQINVVSEHNPGSDYVSCVKVFSAANSFYINGFSQRLQIFIFPEHVHDFSSTMASNLKTENVSFLKHSTAPDVFFFNESIK